MNEKDYADSVMRTWNHNPTPLTPEQMELSNAIEGLAGESGELLDEFKKLFHHQVPLDMIRVKKELGDIRYYYTALYTKLGLTDEEIKEGNNEKLTKRYPTGFVKGGGIRE